MNFHLINKLKEEIEIVRNGELVKLETITDNIEKQKQECVIKGIDMCLFELNQIIEYNS